MRLPMGMFRTVDRREVNSVRLGQFVYGRVLISPAWERPLLWRRLRPNGRMPPGGKSDFVSCSTPDFGCSGLWAEQSRIWPVWVRFVAGKGEVSECQQDTFAEQDDQRVGEH